MSKSEYKVKVCVYLSEGLTFLDQHQINHGNKRGHPINGASLEKMVKTAWIKAVLSNMHLELHLLVDFENTVVAKM